MPELPDILLYLHALAPRILGQRLDRIRLASPFLLRSVDPPLSAIEGRTVSGLDRIGKRIVWAFDDDVFAVFHLMIAGRFRWKPSAAPVPARAGLAAFDFPAGTLVLTEAGFEAARLPDPRPRLRPAPRISIPEASTHSRVARRRSRRAFDSRTTRSSAR